MGDDRSWIWPRIRDFKVWRAEFGENGSLDLGVLDLMELPAKAWKAMFMDMVGLLASVWRERVLERERRGDVEREERRNSMALLLVHLVGLKEDDGGVRW